MRIALGTNQYGYPLREMVIALLQELGHEVVDVGSFTDKPVDYPDIAALVARRVSRGEADRGILMAGTGIGMCIAANKFPGVRAAPCHDELAAEFTRRHNDLNVLCVPASILGELLIGRVIETWLKTPFEGGRHARRVGKIAVLEAENANANLYAGSISGEHAEKEPTAAGPRAAVGVAC
jgi:ribose 5-phosphate isomerase B